jgi:CheY-like chemotaxis protein
MDSSANERLQTILVVEDVEPIRKMICSMLCFSGYNCLEAADGAQALGIVQMESQELHLILTDVVMPEMSGTELARHVASLRPNLPIVFMSGYSDDPVVRSLEHTSSLFLAKPFTASALADKVRNALGRPWCGLPDVRSRSAQ